MGKEVLNDTRDFVYLTLIDKLIDLNKIKIIEKGTRHFVDTNWCIKYIWYLCAGTDNTSQKYKDCISFIQQRLIKEFNIKETVKEKVKRKIYTSYMSNI